MRKSSILVLVLCVVYLLSNIFSIVIIFSNANNLGIAFWPMVGLVFLINLVIQAAILRKRDLRAIRIMFGDDEAYFEFLESTKIFKKKRRI